MRDHRSSLEDFPLHAGEPESPRAREPIREAASDARTSGAVAPLTVRGKAAAADAAAIFLIGAAAILGARAATGQTPRLAGIAWTAAFLLLIWFCATVPALLLFGKTVGMALAELTTHSGAPGSRLSAAAALRRWLGTLVTAATGGLALIWTLRSPDAPTPADRLSGHPLTLE